jgi:hypothetical protein
MFTRAAAIFLIASALAPGAPAQNVERLYPRAKLESDVKLFGEQITAEYRTTILPNLTAGEKAALAAVKIQFPIAGPKGDPFEFYTDGSTVYMPALSLRFFSDLCVANAWLATHGFDGTTVRDYVGLLFREAAFSPTAPLPPVFKTLGIPDNARDENAVSARASRNFGNTVVFLLAHELGHVLAKHRADPADPAQSRAQEIAADRFAIELMRRLPQVPLGLEQWFDYERIRHAAPREIPREAEWQKYLGTLRHPVTTERLNALAHEIENAAEAFARLQDNRPLWVSRTKMFAQFFQLAAPLAGNPVARVVEYARVRDLRLVSLKPRKAVFAVPVPGAVAREEDFQGFFTAHRTTGDGGKAEDFDLLVLRSGDEVTGSYAAGKVQGFVEGRIRDGVLHFTWREGGTTGRGRIESLENGATLRGTWGPGADEQGAGTWSATRRVR